MNKHKYSTLLVSIILFAFNISSYELIAMQNATERVPHDDCSDRQAVQPIIDKIRNIVENECKKETNKLGYEFWSHHILVVVKYGKSLAERLNADHEIVEIAALLHDYAVIKNIAPLHEHHIHGAEEAEKILKGLNYPQEKIARVKQCILAHRSNVNVHETPESRCVASADAIAHIDQVPSLLHHAYKKQRLNIYEGKEWVRKKLERDWNEKLCPIAKEIIQEKYSCAKKILE